MARPQLRNPQQPHSWRLLLGAYEFLASLRLAVFVIFATAAVLACATFIESGYGTEAVRFAVYGSWWFAALLGLLGVNVLAAALIRLPWKRHQTGFVITHAGILVLLVGCVQSWFGGIDAQMGVFEGRTGRIAFENTQHFELEARRDDRPDESPRIIRVPFASGPFNWRDYSSDLLPRTSVDATRLYWLPWRLAHRDWGTIYDRDGIQLTVLDYLSDSRRTPGDPLKLRVQSARDGLPGATEPPWEPVELAGRDASDPHGGQGRSLDNRTQLPHGARIVFWVASSQAETDAFANTSPEGKLGREGQFVFWVAGRRVVLPADAFTKRSRISLGEGTGIEVELVRIESRFNAAEFRVHSGKSQPRRMVLAADFPDLSLQDVEGGVYGAYWLETAAEPVDPAAKGDMKQQARLPRIDILQGVDKRLHYRAWRSPTVEQSGEVPGGGGRVVVFQKSKFQTAFFVEGFRPHDQPGSNLEPVAFAKKQNSQQKTRQARVRLTVDGRSETFWLEGQAADPLHSPPEPAQLHAQPGKGRRATLSLSWDKVDVGFQLYLHKFDRRLDPGTGQASHYSSLVDLCDLSDPPKHVQQKVLITLNEPVNFSDPATSRSYRVYQEAFRGPMKPGDPLFDMLAGGTDREELYLSWLTVNYDPGRGLKYFGCLMIVAGIATMFYMKAYFFKPRAARPATVPATVPLDDPVAK
jgi:hypothetical protein